MSLYQKASLVQIPSGYKAADAKLYSVVPNSGDGDFTVSSDADATRVNKDGLVETTVADQARLNYNFIDGVVQPDPHLLLEPTRTNYATNNSSMDTYGTVGGSSPSPTLTADYTTAPDGSNTATRFQATVTGSNYSLIQFPSTALGDGTYYISVYAKSNTGSNQTISFYGNNSTTNAHTVTTEWTRVIVEATRGSGLTKYAFLGTWASQHGSDASIDISLWGAQIEVDSNYSTSLIPTLGSAVTRTEDNVQIASGAGDIIGSQNEGTLFIDLEIPYDTDSTEYFQFCISDQVSTANRVLFNFISGEVRFQVLYGGGSGQGFCNTSTPKNTRLKIAGSYKTNEFVLYKNGSLADTIDTTGVIDFTTQMETLRFADFGNGKKFQAKVYQMMFFKEALTQSELIKLTS